MYGSDDDDTSYRDYESAERRYEREQFRYDVAAAVLYAVAFLAICSICGFWFSKVRARLASLRTAAAILVLSIILDICVSAISADQNWKLYHDRDLFGYKSADAAIYMNVISYLFLLAIQPLLFMSIVSIGSRIRNTLHEDSPIKGGGRNMVCNIAYGVGGLMLLMAAALFSMYMYSTYSRFNGRIAFYGLGDLAIATRNLNLAYECIMAAAALAAAFLALYTRARSSGMGGKDEPATYVAFGSILLLVAAIFRLAWDVHVSWVGSPYLRYPSYGIVLEPLLITWTMVGAVALLFHAENKLQRGAAGHFGGPGHFA